MSNSWSRRHQCETCGHGYGVHERYKTALRIVDGAVEFYESLEDAPDVCTGYPDQMGECRCRLFVRSAP